MNDSLLDGEEGNWTISLKENRREDVVTPEDRSAVADHVAAYLASGGTVEEVPPEKGYWKRKHNPAHQHV